MNFRIKTLLCVALILLVLGESDAAAVTTSYHIGNSLTNDSQPLGLEAFASGRGLEHQTGYHLHAGWSLPEMLANPEETSADPNEFGKFTEALTNYHWDAVTLQPHKDYPGTQMIQDRDAILTFIDITRSNPENANTNFYIYQTWPEYGNYQQQWLTPIPDLPNSPSTRARDYYDHLIERVRAETDANVYMIPVGEVLYEIDVLIQNKTIPGFSSVNQFYRDSVHLNSEIGRYVASMTTFATILGQYPNQLSKPEGFFTGPKILTPQQEGLLQEVIRDVLDKHAYSGVSMPPPLRADFNGDGTVNLVDLEIWLRSQGKEDHYDFDINGEVDGRDFLAWQRNYTTQLSPEAAAALAVADLNGDGAFTQADVQVWQNAYGLTDGADLDGDGDTDGRDFLLWQRSSPSTIGDHNGDLLVDGAELATWQTSYGYSEIADANLDGLVDIADFDIWESENGRVWTFPYAMSSPLGSQYLASQISVPEPACISLLCVVVGYSLTTRRRIY